MLQGVEGVDVIVSSQLNLNVERCERWTVARLNVVHMSFQGTGGVVNLYRVVLDMV